MCGISGMVSKTPITDLVHVERMQDALHHRGPDGTGKFHDCHVVLAMRRLSIIDLSSGWQPLYNEDRTLVLIANGEIYNFVELRAHLAARGHRFNTNSDCETILHLYEDYEADCVLHLRGMFAFALWDCNRQRLMLARDRMGEKPLYLYEREGQLFFASELKALVKSGLVPFELDPVAVNQYFHYAYVPEPKTPIKGVRKLAAATILIIDVKAWQMIETCYWHMDGVLPLKGDPIKLIRDELEKISELVIRSDVPIGVALSGGLDSSAVAAISTHKYPDTIHAFTVGYPGCPPYDERDDAKALANYLDMPFHDIELSTSDMVTFFPELVFWRDDPIADISGYCYYAISKLARKHNVPVLLQGQGGDELFWGYPWVRKAVRESLQKSALWHKGWVALMNYLEFSLPEKWSPKGLWNWIKSIAGLRTGFERFFLHKKSLSDRVVYYDVSTHFQHAYNRINDIITPTFSESLDGFSVFDLFTFPQPWKHIDILLTRLICQTYLLENGITQGDRLSMASSVELRLPLVDYRLVETVIGLRKSYSDYSLEPKAWFKAALKNILPDWVIKRPKRGFQPPVRAWHEALFDAHGSILEDGYLVNADIIKPESACELSKGPFPSKVGIPLSFKALVLETWCRQFARAAL